MDVGDKLEALRTASVTLNAENLAQQTLLFSLMISLHRSGAVPPKIFTTTFEVASQFLSSLAMTVDGADARTETGEPRILAALRIVEEFRQEFESAR
jgi:hypothetical protein